ncbi:hypothetical protein WJX72_004787 [[Myrmecia] bisecta]|uniref:Rubisco LSMT substrate-binding domain-containing protein n=1 Tax=[Myrmecia] bisecta TaxID=41462 RepID=A0AAW1Q318_9CHLO
MFVDTEVGDTDAAHVCVGGGATSAVQAILPHIQFSDEELHACQDNDTIREALAMRASHQASFQVVKGQLSSMGMDQEDWDWAVAVLHSRCFTEGPAATHMVVPGVDMANHSLTPNATVRCVHSPDACQGQSAVEDVCEAPEMQPSRFELLVGDEPIRATEEVTISYGSWPSDVLFLFFGFVPKANPHDAVVLFRDLLELVQFHDQIAQPDSRARHASLSNQRDPGPKLNGGSSGSSRAGPLPRQPAWPSAEERAELLAESLGADCTRLVVTAEGFDGRVLAAAQGLLSLHQHLPSPIRHMTIGEFLHQRCQHLMQQFPAPLEEDRALLDRPDISANTAMSIRYRMAKKRVLQAAIDAVSQGR